MIDAEDRYNVAEKQHTLLHMMMDFHRFCIEHDISYSIIGGTLLGAIRENGFIPWDDDIDILMDRVNFNKLNRLIDDLIDYYLQERLWVYKIIDKQIFDGEGINEDTPVLDIFIVDRVPSGRIKKRIKVLGLKILQGMMKTRESTRKDLNTAYKAALLFTWAIGKTLSIEKKQKMYTKLSSWGNNDCTQSLMICNDIFQSLDCEYESSLMDEYIMINFETVQLMAISNWDNYLKKQYGDYMKPVRKEH